MKIGLSDSHAYASLTTPIFDFHCQALLRLHLLLKKILKNAFLPTKHLGVPITSFKRVRTFQIELEFGSVGI